MRSPIMYPGGKGRFISKLLPLIPEHEIYAEPCGGGASLLFAKKPAKLEIYNDVHQGVVSLFKVLRDPILFKQFTRMVYMTPYSRQQQKESHECWGECQDDLTRAYHYFISNRQGFTGTQGNETWSHNTTIPITEPLNNMTWLRLITKLPEIHLRLFSSVFIESMDFEKCLRKYDGSNVFFYLDPPYYGVDLYKHNFSEEDHERLILTCSKLEAKVLISNYQNDLYNILDEVGWKSIHFDYNSSTAVWNSNKSGTSRDKANRIETVWMNYELK